MKDICEMFDVNEEQAAALDINMNTAMRAGAGSGKTRVLTKRFVRKLLDSEKPSLESIVAITFTKKATIQMKDRIRKELSERVGKTKDEDEKIRILQLKRQMTQASIDTIHGFCSKLLQDNFMHLGLDPEFCVIEEVDKKVRLQKISEALILSYLDNGDNKVYVDIISNNYGPEIFTKQLISAILEAYQTIREKGFSVDEVLKSTIIKGTTDPVKVLQNTAAILISRLDEQYSQYKAHENYLDFNDLELLAKQLLEDETIRNRLQSRYTTIMVDEFQDVNPLQKEILDHLTINDGKLISGRLFIVGDHKQSIYGFRGSDYRVFGEACTQIEQVGKVTYLQHCYRSTSNIINAVNKIFAQILTPYERLNNPDIKGEGEKVTLVTWNKVELKENKPKTRWELSQKLLSDEKQSEELKSVLFKEYDESAITSKKDYQGDAIAGYIKKLVGKGLKYKDVAILLQSRASLPKIEKALITQDIKFCTIGGIGFWGRQEIVDILFLYKFIFKREDKLLLFSVLRSPIFGLSDDLLLAISIYIRKVETKSPDELLSGFLKEVASDEAWLVKRAAKIFSVLLPLEGIHNAYNLMQQVITETEYAAVLAALPQGEKKLRNVEKLLQITEAFEAKGLYSARDLIDYLEVLQNSSGMDAEAFLDNEDSNAVKILTIHASKGLEFPAIIIPDMDRKVDRQSKSHKPFVFVHQHKGIIAMGLDENMEMKEDSNPEYEVLYLEKNKREMEEARRLFYVASTRAEDYLAFIGEEQEIKVDDLEAQDSFMKLLQWAMLKADPMEEISIAPAADLISDRSVSGVSLDHAMKGFNEITNLKELEDDAISEMMSPCSKNNFGSISISAWMKFRDCPRQFFLEYLVGLTDKKESLKPMSNQEQEGTMQDENRDREEKMLSATEFGTLFHTFLEKVDITQMSSMDVISNMEVERMEDIELPAADVIRFKRLMKNFIKIEAERRKASQGEFITSMKEFGFQIPLNEDLNLTGVIDRIDLYKKDGRIYAVIIDYKTSRIEDMALIKERARVYEGQLLSYALAINSLPIFLGEKVEVVEALLYFLDCSQVVSVLPDKSKIEDMQLELQSAASWLLGNKPMEAYLATTNKHCAGCKCKKYCEDLN